MLHDIDTVTGLVIGFAYNGLLSYLLVASYCTFNDDY